jgi:hypothetical protein
LRRHFDRRVPLFIAAKRGPAMPIPSDSIDAFLFDHADKMIAIQAKLRQVLAEAQLQRLLMNDAMQKCRELRESSERARVEQP